MFNNFNKVIEKLPLLGFFLIILIILVPMGSELLDLLIGINLIMSLFIISLVFTTENPLKLTSFPSLILLSTLFRLSLNISSTRLILSNGSAGEFIQSIGEIVIQNNLLIGFIIFIILSLIQYMVISKGSERIAEVAARFNLDALPGKQMSIDADLRSGLISTEEAKKRRNQLHVESKLYGSLDGAMKFVKGDAILGWIVLIINLLGGLYTGIVVYGFSLEKASYVYLILTVGDGLLNQIPSLMIALSAGLIVSRVNDENSKSHLAEDIVNQVFKKPQHFFYLSIACFFAGFIPFLPFKVLFFISMFFMILFFVLKTRTIKPQTENPGKPNQFLLSSSNLAQPLVLEVSPKMAENFSTKNQWKLFFDNYYPNLQDHLYELTGIIFPDLHIKINSHLKNPYQYKIMIHHVLYQWGKFFNNDQVIPLHYSNNADLNQTYYGTPLIDKNDSDPSSEYVQFTPEMMLIRHLYRALKENQSEFLGIQEVKLLVDELESFYPDLVNEVLPRYITLTKLTSILKRLAEEQIPITNLKMIFEILAQIQPDSKDIIYVVEEIRCGLKSQISQIFANDDYSINAITLDYDIEDEIRSSIREQGEQMYLTMDPERISDLNQEIKSILEKQEHDIIILTQRDIRRFVRKIISEIDVNLFVLSYQELDPKIDINIKSTIGL